MEFYENLVKTQIQPLVKQLTDLNLRLTELVVKMEMLHKKSK